MNEPPATRIVLVRHGESLVSVRRVVGGLDTCCGLSEWGHQQATALCQRLVDTAELADATALLSSTMPRAVETAAAIRAGVGDGALDIEPRPDLCELHPGEGDGLPWEEFTRRYGQPNWRVDPSRVLSPGGESWTSFMARAGAALRRVVAEHEGRTVVIACHGGIVQAAMVEWCRLTDLGAVVELQPHNTSLTGFTWRPAADGHPGRWRLERYNDAAHLAHLGN